MPIVDVPGQGLVEFPDTMTDAEIGLAISRQRASSIVKPASYGAGSEALSGLTFGFGDELRSKLTGEPIESIRAGQERYRQQNPATAVAANIAGSLPTMLIPGIGAGNVLRGIGMAGKAARAVSALGTGAAYGGLSGAGEATSDRGAAATRGAITGAILSPVGALAGRGVQAVAQRRLSSIPADLQAQAKLLGTLKAGGVNPTAAVPRAGQTIAEMTKPAEVLAGAVVRRSPEQAGKTAAMFAERKAARPEQLMNTVQAEVAGGNAPTMAQIDKMSAAQKQAAKPFYEQAYAQAQPIQSPLIDDLMTLEPFQQAYKRAQSIAKLERSPIPDYVPGQPISLRTANYIKQGLDEVVYGAKRDPASSIGKTQLGLVDQLRGDFVREVDQQAPEAYRTARKIYAGAASDQEAAQAGAKAWNYGPEYVADFLSSASKSEQDSFRVGANAELRKMQSKLGSNREAFRALMDTPNAQSVVQQLSQIEGPSAIPALARQQKAAAEFEQRLSGGSQTAERTAADQLLNQPDLMQSIADKGITKTAYQATLGKIADYYRTGGDKTTTELGNMLLNPDASSNMETLRKLGILDEQLRRQAGIRAGAYSSGAGFTGLLGGTQ